MYVFQLDRLLGSLVNACNESLTLLLLYIFQLAATGDSLDCNTYIVRNGQRLPTTHAGQLIRVVQQHSDDPLAYTNHNVNKTYNNLLAVSSMRTTMHMLVACYTCICHHFTEVHHVKQIACNLPVLSRTLWEDTASEDRCLLDSNAAGLRSLVNGWLLSVDGEEESRACDLTRLSW